MPNMATAVTAIYRYPVKGLSAEKMDRVVLMPGECLPHDRRFAIALGSTPFDPERPGWLSKTHFIMLMSDEKLAQVQTRFDVEKGVLTIADNGRVLLLARMTEPEGCRLVAEFFANFLGDAVNGPLRVVEAPGHAFADARRKRNATGVVCLSQSNQSIIAVFRRFEKAWASRLASKGRGMNTTQTRQRADRQSRRHRKQPELGRCKRVTAASRLPF